MDDSVSSGSFIGSPLLQAAGKKDTTSMQLNKYKTFLIRNKVKFSANISIISIVSKPCMTNLQNGVSYKYNSSRLIISKLAVFCFLLDKKKKRE
jgi:hypothetical protein